MILKPFFRRHFWVTAIVFALILGVASSLSNFLIRMDRSDFFQTHGTLILNRIEGQEGDKVAFVRALNQLEHDLGIQLHADLIKDGVSLLDGKPHALPDDASSPEQHRQFVHEISLPEKATLVVNFGNGPRQSANGPRRNMSITFAVMLIGIILASSLSIFLLFWNFRDKAELAKTVLTRMQKGDLKARFPVGRLDEAGQIMGLYNQMADEIERLVEQLKLNESHRIQLLQELTHDLRTPVSSLRNLIETLQFNSAKLDGKQREELVGLAYQETEYLTRLVEDLLFLALVLEPKYKPDTGEVHLLEILTAQLTVVSAQYPKIHGSINNQLQGRLESFAGNPHLMQRLFRNALENAFSFARLKVEVTLEQRNGLLVVMVRDDGPGLSEEAIANYGKKRPTRYQVSHQEGRISVGLGSVIIQAIASAHSGKLNIENLKPGCLLTVELKVD